MKLGAMLGAIIYFVFKWMHDRRVLDKIVGENTEE